MKTNRIQLIFDDGGRVRFVRQTVWKFHQSDFSEVDLGSFGLHAKVAFSDR